MIRILLVNDHHQIRVEMKEMIEKEIDMMVIVEEKSERALERVMAEDFDMVIVDVNRSIEEVIGFTRQLHRINSDVDVMMVSSLNMEIYFDEAIHAGISAFIHKPYSWEQMIRSIRSLKKGEAIIPTPLLKKLRRG